ncbi:MAG: hypothetical protein D3909_19260 [Candidatus Electrothrix sp. ATG1]|nr:hypothetical protein [Candidatus Electrothrix sp. ATG1]
MTYDEIVKQCEALKYRDKLRLAQLLIQLARKEEEVQHPQRRVDVDNQQRKKVSKNKVDDVTSIQYVADRITKLRPGKKKTLLNSIRAMYQFQGGISEKDQERIVTELQKRKILKIEANNRVTYL